MSRSTAQPKTAVQSGIHRLLADHLGYLVPPIETFKRAPLLNASVGVAANLDWELQGTNAANSNVNFADGGGIVLTTAGADNDQMILAPHADTKQTGLANWKWNTNDRVGFACRIKTDAVITGALIVAGLGLTAAMDEGTDDDQILFTYDTDNSDTTFKVNVSIDGSDEEYDTGVTVAADTDYILEMKIDGQRIPRFWIDGVPVGPIEGNLSDPLAADHDLKPYVGVQALTGAARALGVRAIAGPTKDFND